jgi:hypothetical protein
MRLQQLKRENLENKLYTNIILISIALTNLYLAKGTNAFISPRRTILLASKYLT